MQLFLSHHIRAQDIVLSDLKIIKYLLLQWDQLAHLNLGFQH